MIRYIVYMLLFINIFFTAHIAYAGVFSYAAKETGVSSKILKSVSYVESGFHPYALDINGTPSFPKTYASAYYIARYFINKGYLVDIGLMQVNYNIWAKRLSLSLRELLEPQINTQTGAYILGRYILKQNSIVKGIGEYHSGNFIAAKDYEIKVLNAYSHFFSR
jgi:soluble lytic murein transglycosylase-like protein